MVLFQFFIYFFHFENMAEERGQLFPHLFPSVSKYFYFLEEGSRREENEGDEVSLLCQFDRMCRVVGSDKGRPQREKVLFELRDLE